MQQARWMAAVSERGERGRPSPFVELGLGVSWLLGISAALQILDRLFPAASLGTALIGALLVDVAASRLGVRWGLVAGADRAASSPFRLAAWRAGIGVSLAFKVGLLVIAIGAAAGWIHNHGGWPQPSFAIVLALLRAIAVSVRDELLYRGIPLFAASRAGVPAWAARLFAALAGGAAIALMPGVEASGIVLAVASGWLFAGLWQKEGGGFAAGGAHAAWLLLFGSLLHGGLFEVEWVHGNIAIGNGSSGPPAWIASGLCIAAGLILPRITWPGGGAKSS
ncbi:MAG: hypothetical protein QM820_56255 [Minicystis sp.]